MDWSVSPKDEIWFLRGCHHFSTGLYIQFMLTKWKAQFRGCTMLDSSWNVMAHSDARERKWRGNWRMEWVASTLHTTSIHGVSSITTADAHISAASSRLNWRPRRFKWTRPFRRKTKSGFCACAIIFQLVSTIMKFAWTEYEQDRQHNTT